MISFNPGPSQLSAATLADLAEIAASGLLSKSHRGRDVVDVCRAAFDGVARAMALPPGWRVLYQPSATAAMDTVLANLAGRRSFHFVHGAFSERWFTTARESGLACDALRSDDRRAVPWRDAAVPSDADLVAVTHNETATGLMWPAEEISALRRAHPAPLLAVDVTSSFGALAMPWADADVWFASVQKCLGLPAGMALLVVGPRAMERVAARGASGPCVPAWRNLASMAAKMADAQTTETPNVLAIALLARQMARWDLAAIETATRAKAAAIYGAPLPWTPHVEDAAWRSLTVANFRVTEPVRWTSRATSAGFTLGSGYGPLKPSCVRIANFPAHSEGDVARLLAALTG